MAWRRPAHGRHWEENDDEEDDEEVARLFWLARRRLPHHRPTIRNRTWMRTTLRRAPRMSTTATTTTTTTTTTQMTCSTIRTTSPARTSRSKPARRPVLTGARWRSFCAACPPPPLRRPTRRCVTCAASCTSGVCCCPTTRRAVMDVHLALHLAAHAAAPQGSVRSGTVRTWPRPLAHAPLPPRAQQRRVPGGPGQRRERADLCAARAGHDDDAAAEQGQRRGAGATASVHGRHPVRRRAAHGASGVHGECVLASPV